MGFVGGVELSSCSEHIKVSQWSL